MDAIELPMDVEFQIHATALAIQQLDRDDVEKGGETQFPNINIKMKPKEGTLIAWNNLNIDGTNNENTLHEALPPESGKKYVITKWWRSWNLI